MPQVAVLDNPEDHYLEAFCDRCHDVVDAVCPKCRGHVHPAGACTTNAPERSSYGSAQFYRRFANLIQASRNSKFMLACYLIATGDAYADGITMEHTAEAWGVCKGTVSKQCVFICKYLGIPPSPYMRKEDAGEKFRQSNRRPTKHE